MNPTFGSYLGAAVAQALLLGLWALFSGHGEHALVCAVGGLGAGFYLRSRGRFSSLENETLAKVGELSSHFDSWSGFAGGFQLVVLLNRCAGVAIAALAAILTVVVGTVWIWLVQDWKSAMQAGERLIELASLHVGAYLMAVVLVAAVSLRRGVWSKNPTDPKTV